MKLAISHHHCQSKGSGATQQRTEHQEAREGKCHCPEPPETHCRNCRPLGLMGWGCKSLSLQEALNVEQVLPSHPQAPERKGCPARRHKMFPPPPPMFKGQAWTKDRKGDVILKLPLASLPKEELSDEEC